MAALDIAEYVDFRNNVKKMKKKSKNKSIVTAPTQT